MGKMEQTLKAEIIRIAKKEVRKTYLPLARDVRRLKRTVSTLRKSATDTPDAGSRTATSTCSRLIFQTSPGRGESGARHWREGQSC